jgi:hypothetical protein
MTLSRANLDSPGGCWCAIPLAEGRQPAQQEYEQSLWITTGKYPELAMKMIRAYGRKRTCQFRRKLPAVLFSPGSDPIAEREQAASIVANVSPLPI